MRTPKKTRDSGFGAHASWLRCAIAGAILLLGAATAGAQDTTSEVSPGGKGPGWTFTPGLSFGGVYDSNVALAAVSPTRQQAQSDQLLLAEPFAQLDYLAKRTEFSGGYQGYIRRYMDLDQLNGFDQHGHASLRRLVSKYVTLAFSDDYARVPTTDEIEVNGVPFSRTGARRNALAGRLTARLSKFMDLSVKYDNTWVSFDRTDSLLTGGTVNGVTTGLSRRVRPRISVGAEYAVRFADLNEGTRQLIFHDAGATAQIGLNERTSASFGLGYSYLDDRSLHETRTGPYVRAEVTHGTEHATLGAAFERMFVPSFGFGGSSQSEQLRGYIRMPLNRNRMYVQGSGAWRRTDPFLAGELPLDTTALRGTLGYSVTRHLRVEVFDAFTRQDSRIAGGRVNRQRIGVQIVISQPMRIQ
jgi:hypothetical protein